MKDRDAYGISDKAVGDMWRQYKADLYALDLLDLIRKIVRERANRYHGRCPRCESVHGTPQGMHEGEGPHTACPCEVFALQDFGIREAEWNLPRHPIDNRVRT